MDTDKIILVIAEKDRWASRKEKIEGDLIEVKRNIKILEKRRKRIAREISRLQAVDTAVSERSVKGENERTTPILAFR